MTSTPVGNMPLASKTEPPKAPTSTLKSEKKKTFSADRLYQDAKKRRQKLEETKKRYDAINKCSFKPKINNSYSSTRTKKQENRFDSLYKAGLERKNRLAEKQRELEETERELAKKTKVSPGSRKKETVSISGKSRLEQLYQDGLNKAEKLRKGGDGGGLSADCTFRPKINRKSLSPPKRSEETASNEDVCNRLYAQGKKLMENREKIKKKFEVNYSFQPKLNTNRAASSSVALCPTKDELVEVQMQRELEKMEIELKDCTFTPNVIKTSPAVISKPTAPENVHRRLFSDAKDARERKERIRLEFMERERKMYQEQLERLRSKTRGASSKLQVDEPVFDRLYEHGVNWISKKLEDELVASSRRELDEWERNELECTFQPEVHSLADTTLGDQLLEKGPVFDRLYSQALARVEKREWEQYERYGLDLDCTFAPNINAKSRELALNREARLSQRSKSTVGDELSLELSNSDCNSGSVAEEDSVASAALPSEGSEENVQQLFAAADEPGEGAACDEDPMVNGEEHDLEAKECGPDV